MTLAVWYWLFTVLFVLHQAYGVYRTDPAGRVSFGVGSLLLIVLLLLLGLKVFGSPITGG